MFNQPIDNQKDVKEQKRLIENKRHNERYAQRIAQMSSEELAAFRLKQKEKRERYLKNQTKEAKDRHRENAKYHMRKLRATWTSERKTADVEWHKQWRKKAQTPEWIEKERARGRENKRLLKEQVIRHYSNGEMRCMCPTCEVPGGAKDLASLTIDHINGGGRKHNEELIAQGIKVGLYRWLVINNFPSGFQVYCWVCNNKKRMTNNENHHSEPITDTQKKQQLYRKNLLLHEKELVVNHYSHGTMRCMNPDCEVPGGLKDLDGLTIDHINGGGKQHMKQLKAQGVTMRFYSWLIRNNYPDNIGLQVLCWNCNNRKRKANREDHYAIKGKLNTQHLPKEEKENVKSV